MAVSMLSIENERYQKLISPGCPSRVGEPPMRRSDFVIAEYLQTPLSISPLRV